MDMANERILIIEDDDDLRTILADFLKKEGYQIKLACNGKEGIELSANYKPQLILLDLMLPKVDGFEVCRVIRNNSMAPIMILSARNSDMDKMLSLGIGADDYLTKPFSMVELHARMKSHLRRYAFSERQEHGVVNEENDAKNGRYIGEVYIDSFAYVVKVKDQKVDLTAREFKLLDFMASHPSQVFSKEQLLDNVWGESEFIDMNTITVYIGRIREKMTKAGACYIKTVWGAGYKWEI
jgi:DNA-binding response OmpR family regulator